MSTSRDPRILIAIVGPTASGKSSLAISAALELDGEIVNCDSMQMIRGMEIGTAKPTDEERRKVPHHLFDRITPDEFYSAGRYMVEARAICEQIRSRGKIPVVVGGTGLYLRALLEGIFEGPGKSPEIRRRLKRIAEKKGDAHLHALLARKDPLSAERIHTSDRTRILRALEVYFASGQPISSLQPRKSPLKEVRILKFGIRLPRQVLYQRIEDRVARMFEGGLLEEVERLLKEYSPQSKGFEALGYRHAAAHLRGEIGRAEAIERTARDTRRYAKRQMTWFRKETHLHWIDAPGESKEALNKLLQRL